MVLALLPPLGMALYTNLEQRRLGMEELRADTLRFTRIVAANQETLVEGARHVLITLAQLPEVNDSGSDECSSLLTKLTKRYKHYSVFGAADARGNTYCGSAPKPVPVDVADRLWFQRAVKTRDFAVGDFEIGRVTEKPTIHFSYPIIDRADRLRGVVFAGLNLEKVNPFTAEAELVEGASIVLFDSRGTILSQYPEPEKWIGKPFPDSIIIEAAQKEDEGIIERRGVDGVDRIYAFTSVHGELDTGLFVSIGTPVSVALSGAERLLIRNLSGLLLACVLALAAAWHFSNLLILRRIRGLLGATQRLAAGDLSARSGLSLRRDELSRLAEAFDEMASSLERQAIRLKEAESRYRSLVEQIPAITYRAQLDDVGSILYVSPQIENLAGFTAEQWQSDPGMWFRCVAEEDREAIAEEIADLIRRPERTDFTIEYRLRTRSGRMIWISDKGTVERRQGEVSVVQGVMLDVTDRHEAEEKLLLYQEQLRSMASELALAEERERRRIAVDLHDLIAQKLALSKIKLEAIGDSVEAAGFAEQVQQIHQFLDQCIQDTRSLIYRISSPILYELGFEAAVEWLVEEFQRLYSVPCSYENDGSFKPLDNDVRVILFQSVNELLVNVAKHADASDCELSLRREENSIHIELRDNGVGFDVQKLGPHSCKAGGFGLFSIRERLNRVGGHCEIDSEPGRGARISLVAPLKLA